MNNTCKFFAFESGPVSWHVRETCGKPFQALLRLRSFDAGHIKGRIQPETLMDAHSRLIKLQYAQWQVIGCNRLYTPLCRDMGPI